jgi:protein-arginine kinase activator protein McsA
MKCQKCGISVMKAPLQRVNEKGVGGIWWCEPCIEAHEPELARNIKEDETKVEKDLKDILGFK